MDGKKGRSCRTVDSPDRNAEIQRLLIEGELAMDADGKKVRVHPTSTEIATRLGVSKSWISKFAHKNRCFQQRAVFQAKLNARAQEKIIERESTKLAFDTERTLSLCDKVLAGYEVLIGERGISNFSAADLNTVVRLRRFLQGDADSRQEVTSSITLEALQTAHRDMIQTLSTVTSEECGIESEEVDGNPPALSLDDAGPESEVDPKVDHFEEDLNVREEAKPDIAPPADTSIRP